MQRSGLTLTISAVIAGLAGASLGLAPAPKGRSVLQIVPSPTSGAYTENFNPFSTSALPFTAGAIYQTLFYFNQVGPQVYPVLGTHYHWSNGNTTLTVDLRHGVKWSNGMPFTSKDVVFTFNLLKRFPALDTNAVWNHLKSVSAAGTYQVVFRFLSADVPFGWYVLGQTYIVPQAVWKKFSNPKAVTNTHPVGTGAYTLGRFSPQAYFLKANPRYWGGKPKIATLEFPEFNSNSSASVALASGKTGWAGLFVPNVQHIFVSKQPATNHYWYPATNLVMLFTNLKNPLLSQLPVRRAISLAINRQELYRVGEYGYETVASPTGLVLPANRTWMNPHLPKNLQHFQYNPQAAVKLLEHAGFHRRNGKFFTKAGKPLSLVMNVNAGASDWAEDASIIARNLGSIGIHVTLHPLTGSYYPDLLTGHYQMAIWWGGNPTGPSPYYLYQSMLAPKSANNFEHWHNTTTTKALQAFAATRNPARQHAAVAKIQQVFAGQLPSIPLLNGVAWYEYNSSHVVGWPTAKNPYAVPAPWSYPANEVILSHLRLK